MRKDGATTMDAILDPVAVDLAANLPDPREEELQNKLFRLLEPPAGIEPATC
jgi:hypothetical protein